MTELLLSINIAQGIWIVAFIASMVTFLMKQDQKFILMMVLVSAIWSMHFFMLGLLSAALINFVDIFKNLLALKYKKNNYITWATIILYILIWMYTYSWWSIIDILPVIASLTSIYVVFQLQWIQMRLWFLWILLFWLIYNYTGWSIWGVMSDVSLIIVGLIGIWRIKRDKKS